MIIPDINVIQFLRQTNFLLFALWKCFGLPVHWLSFVKIDRFFPPPTSSDIGFEISVKILAQDDTIASFHIMNVKGDYPSQLQRSHYSYVSIAHPF